MRPLAAQSKLLSSVSLAVVMGVSLCALPARADQPQFGVEVEAGSALGFAPYLRNEVVTEVDRARTDADGQFYLQPSLADVETGAGTSLAVRLVATNIAGGLSLRWFDLTENQVHHAGQQSIAPDRLRDDGSIDDSGVDYSRLDPPIEEPIAEDDQERLFVMGLGGEYRFLWPGEAFDFFVPAGGQVLFTYVTGDDNPYRFGLEASSGVGMSVEFVSGVSLMLSGKVHGLLTSHYGRRADAARRAVIVGESTEEAYFSTLLYGSANLALQFRIR